MTGNCNLYEAKNVSNFGKERQVGSCCLKCHIYSSEISLNSSQAISTLVLFWTSLSYHHFNTLCLHCLEPILPVSLYCCPTTLAFPRNFTVHPLELHLSSGVQPSLTNIALAAHTQSTFDFQLCCAHVHRFYTVTNISPPLPPFNSIL